MLLVLVALPFALSLVAPAVARLGRTIRPAHGALLCLMLVVVLGLGSAGALALLGWYSLARLPMVAAAGSWPHVHAAHASPLPLPLTDAAGIVALLAGAVALGDLVRAWRALALAHRHAEQLPGVGPEGAALVADDVPGAYVLASLPGRRRRVVFTQGLIDLVDDEECLRGVYLHELAHARLHHVWLRVLAQATARANPLLRPVRTELDHALECWADDRAAAVVGRTKLATTLATVALAQPAGPRARVLGAVGGDVVARVWRLVDPPANRALAPTAVSLLLCGTTVGAIATACRITEKTFEALMALC